MKDKIANIFAILWFFCVLIETVFFTAIIILGVFFCDIMAMLKSGFTSSAIGFIFLFIASFIFSITGWVPAFRKCYYKLPWLYPLCMFLVMHLFILSTAEVILAKGFSIISPTRHVTTIIIMVVQVVACRVAMCWYLKKNPMIVHKYDKVE